MSLKVLYDAKLGSNVSEWYGTLEVSDVRYDDGSQVTVQKFLVLTLQSPVEISGGDINVLPSPWVQTAIEIDNNPNKDNIIDVRIKVLFVAVSLFNFNSTITIGVNGNLAADPDLWLRSIALFVDESPSSCGIISPRSALNPPTGLARLASQPAAFSAFIGRIINNTFGCCFGRDDDLLDEKRPGKIALEG